MVILCYDVILYIGEFMFFTDRIAPTSKRIVNHHLKRKSMCLHTWKSKRLVFTYLKMFGPFRHTWLTWKRFGKKQLQLTRRTRNLRGKGTGLTRTRPRILTISQPLTFFFFKT